MPLLTAWIPSTEHDARDAGRSRFQLDAPPIAGRPFFEMVSFMLQELAVLEKEAKEYAGAFDGSQSRYRYVYELFIAALLYFTNKCGTHEFRHARDTLFAWAYTLRVAMTRVQFASADNRARGKDAASPFVLMRNTAPVQALRQLSVQLKPPHAEHEKALVAFITKTNAP